jgi:hypothetical protein
VTSIAVATTIVTATMVSMGYAPDLGDVRTSEDAGVLSAFVSGLRLLYLIMGSVLLIGVAASFFKGSQQTEKSTEPAPESEARTTTD